MKNIKLLLLVTILLNLSCSKDDNLNIETLWVDSVRVNCTGVGEQTCYRIQKNTTINENDWSLFYDAIEGFDDLFEAGYIYNIRVIKIKVENPPADGSSIRYVLNEIINKELDE
jgi:hypothetical protein